jgi:hypothetical protein
MKKVCIHQHNVKQSTSKSLCMLPLNIPLIAIWTWRRCNPFATPQFLPKKQQEMQGMIRNNSWKRKVTSTTFFNRLTYNDNLSPKPHNHPLEISLPSVVSWKALHRCPLWRIT